NYDGTTTATITASGTVVGTVGSDDVGVANGMATFADKNAGTGKTVTFSGFALTGEDKNNYTLQAQPTAVT
ncbi:YDG domain-containing protein, partial [Candidatus Symbiothrix dinenymphae]